MIFRSPHPDVELSDRTLTEYVLRRAGEFGDKPALIDGPTGRTLTFAQLSGAIRKAAAGLAQAGFRKGDVFAIYSPNIPEYAVAFHAVAMLGGINTTTNPLYTVEELAYQLNDSGARFLVTVEPFLENARAAAGQSGVEEIYVFGEGEGATPFASLLDNDGRPPEVPIDTRKDLVVLPYSSGTTGLPKGVMLSHFNLVANMCQLVGFADLTAASEQDTLVGVLPFFHIYGMLVILNYGLSRGATVITMPRFDMEQFLGILQNHQVTFAHLVPPIVLGLAKHPAVDDYEFPKLRGIFSGAASLGEGVSAEAEQRLGCVVIQGYGLTETSPVTHVSPDRPGAIKRTSIGQCLPNTEVKIVDIASGAEMGPNLERELLIKRPQVMQGYLDNPQATADVMEGEWFHTGDIGYADEEGYFYIVDRLKELIKYKGFQVAPAELEAVLLSHPAVADAAVIPSPDEEAGEVPKAFVVLRGEATAEELMAFVAEHVSPQKRIRRLEFAEEIPKSLSGKILRRVLVEKERRGANA
jgi:acyl-CoA synthetase (AMP-forming)/AMP-acid ligase II